MCVKHDFHIQISNSFSIETLANIIYAGYYPEDVSGFVKYESDALTRSTPSQCRPKQ